MLFVDGVRVYSVDAGAVTYLPDHLARARVAIAQTAAALKGLR